MALVTIGVTLPGSWLRWVARTQDMDSGSSGFGSRGGKSWVTRWVRRCVQATWLILALPFWVFYPFSESHNPGFSWIMLISLSPPVCVIALFHTERERWSRNYPPMFIGPQTDVKPPTTPQKIKTVIKSTSRSSQCRMTRHSQLFLPLDQATAARRRSRRHQGRVGGSACQRSEVQCTFFGNFPKLTS